MPESVRELGKSADRMHIIDPHLAVTGQEIEFFLLVAGNVQNSAGENFFTEKLLPDASFGDIEFVGKNDPSFFAGDQENQVRLFDAVFVGQEIRFTPLL